ncbi:hypothetical protein Fuma_06099 [Fuerstiella marisgermanici]|uniref:Uncharacterized protein n=1 Tax=Fuerstiella marisgermanici TaxID=1891926 RepID=A0A1P8WQU7_9PLAN|nr:hypothetical protein Fuma_06099 [Fuerstiella marisgermanici]
MPYPELLENTARHPDDGGKAKSVVYRMPRCFSFQKQRQGAMTRAGRHIPPDTVMHSTWQDRLFALTASRRFCRRCRFSVLAVRVVATLTGGGQLCHQNGWRHLVIERSQQDSGRSHERRHCGSSIRTNF